MTAMSVPANRFDPRPKALMDGLPMGRPPGLGAMVPAGPPPLIGVKVKFGTPFTKGAPGISYVGRPYSPPLAARDLVGWLAVAAAGSASRRPRRGLFVGNRDGLKAGLKNSCAPVWGLMLGDALW